MKTLAVFGAAGGLARELSAELIRRQYRVDAVCRSATASTVRERFSNEIQAGALEVKVVNERYSEFEFTRAYDGLIFTQALFDPTPIVALQSQTILDEVSVGLSEPMILTQRFLQKFPVVPNVRRNICFIGSTSAYAGFRNTSVYCAVKHGLLGFVRALNDEYAGTDDRFWLFSMGTMKTAMGDRVPGQDVSTYLDPRHVAERIISAIASATNLFEPEVVIRRRTVGFL